MKPIINKNKVCVRNIPTNCESSAFLANSVLKFLQVNGYEVVFDDSSDCDVILINTCVVIPDYTSLAERVVEQALSETPMKQVVVFGCFHRNAKMNSANARAVIIGPKEVNKFNDVFAHVIPIEDMSVASVDHHFFSADKKYPLTQNDVFVLICQGCLQNCSYCNTKLAKGGVASRSVAEIMADIRESAKLGKAEIALVGDDCGSYGMDINTDLSTLIKAILTDFPDLKLKISAIYPGHLIRLFLGLKDSFASGKITFMSLPIQSGSERVLADMNRSYDLGRLKDVIAEIRRLAPRLFIYTHIIVNFPTETREDFLCSLRFAALFDDFEFIKYADNPLTPASKITSRVEPTEGEKRLKICAEMLKRVSRGSVRQVMKGEGYIGQDNFVGRPDVRS